MTWEIIKSGRVLIPSKYLELPKNPDPRWSKDMIEFYWEYDYNGECIRWNMNSDPIVRTWDNEIDRCKNHDPLTISNRKQYDLCLHLLKTWNRKDAILNMRSESDMVRKISCMILDLDRESKGIKILYD
jgi:hypothetical protein